MWDNVVQMILLCFAAVLIIGLLSAVFIKRSETAYDEQACKTSVSWNKFAKDYTGDLAELPLLCNDIPVTVKPSSESAFAEELARHAAKCWNMYSGGDNDQIRSAWYKINPIFDVKENPLCYPCYTFTADKGGFLSKDVTLPRDVFTHYLANTEVIVNREKHLVSSLIGKDGFVLVAGVEEFQQGVIYEIKYFDTDTKVAPWWQKNMFPVIGELSLAFSSLRDILIYHGVAEQDEQIAQHYATRDGILITPKSVFDSPEFQACQKVYLANAGADGDTVI